MTLELSPKIRLVLYVAIAAAVGFLLWNGPAVLRPIAWAQGPATTADGGPSSAPAPAASGATPEFTPPATTRDKSINLWQLTIAGGIFMIPIFGFSFLAATMTIERFIALRRQRILPAQLVSGLGQLAGPQGHFDPRKAYRLCQQFPSSAASVLKAVLLKVGRPLSEIEGTATQTSQREADKLYTNVRWLNLSASVSTMLGLIGTIQGMIMAFHQLTILEAGTDRTQVLAAGIYTALVTTFAGLCVAIPAATISHLFESKIQHFFREIDELVGSLLPQLERYEGRVRFNRQPGDGEAGSDDKPAPALAQSE